jgi:hypothetical protein
MVFSATMPGFDEISYLGGANVFLLVVTKRRL